jgi:type II secretory pathway component GspD/PulD (secretin)
MKKTRPLVKAILLSLFLTVFALNISAQKVTLSFQNETFEKVLNSIKQQTGLSLVFSEQLVNLNRKVSIKVNSIEVEDAMKQLLAGTNLGYEIKNNKLYLIENKNSEPKKADGQSKKINGLVTDEKGDPNRINGRT